MQDGVPHGRGKLHYPKDDSEGWIGASVSLGSSVYEGDFVEGRRHGHGRFSDGRSLEKVPNDVEAVLANDEPGNLFHSHNMELRSLRYVGQWVDDVKEG